jgi:hypothetical protein
LAIPTDTYFIATPGSEFLSKSYATLNGTDLFFYVTETGSLRVVNMNSVASPPSASPGTISFSIVPKVKWVHALSQTGIVHVYYASTDSTIFYVPYTLFGGMARTPQPITTASAVTFSVLYSATSSPPCYAMVVDDGINHNLYVASDPAFSSALASPVVTYNNALDHTVYVTRPVIAQHPQDTNLATVVCQSTVVATSESKVGFYEVRLPGVS